MYLFVQLQRHVVQYRTGNLDVGTSVISVSGFIELSFDSVKCNAERK
jgi:hypothetical protein